MGLMDAIKSPAFATWLGGLGSAIDQNARGRGFDMSQTNQAAMQQMQQQQMHKKLGGLMEGMDLNPQQQQFLQAAMQYDPGLGMQLAGSTLFDGKDKAEWERKAENLMAMGAPEEVAYGIQTGRYKTVSDPVTKELRVIDMASGRPYQGWQPPQGAGQAMSGGGEAPPAPVQPQPPQTPGQGYSPAMGEAPRPAPEEKKDFTSAFGLEGVFKNLANVAGDFLGLGQAYPDAASAKRAMENLNAQTSTLLAQGVDTRGGKYLIDRFDKIQPEAASIGGPEDAVKTLKEIRGMLQRGYEIDSRIAQSAVSPTEKSKARANMERLRPLIEEYDQILGQFQSQFYGGQEGLPGPQPFQGAGPQPGTVEDGYRFMGGNPADPNSWQKVE